MVSPRTSQYAPFVGSLALNEASTALVASGASESLLIHLCNGNMNLVQRFEAWVNSAGTAADVLLKPRVGSGLDVFGRSWALMLSQLGFALLRASTWRAPTLVVYTTLRVGVRLLGNLYGPAVAATYADLVGGRASASFAGAVQRSQVFLSLGFFTALLLATRLQKPASCFGAAALCNLGSAMLVRQVGETLQQQERPKRFAPFFSWVSFFRRTPRLKRLAVALLLGHVASSNPTDRFVLFSRFGLTAQQRSKMSAVEALLRMPLQLLMVGQLMLAALLLFGGWALFRSW